MPSLPVPESTMQTARSPRSCGQRAEEVVDRQAPAARRLGLHEAQAAAHERHVLVRRHDVDAAGLHGGAVLDPGDLHARVPLHEVEQQALVVGVEVLDEHERHAQVAVGGQRREELLDGGEAAGGGADADDRERRRIGRRRGTGPSCVSGWSTLRSRLGCAWQVVDANVPQRGRRCTTSLRVPEGARGPASDNLVPHESIK